MRKKIAGVEQRGASSFRINYRDTEGLRHFETIAAASIEEAALVRQARLIDIANGRQISSKPNMVTFEELAADVVNDYKHNNFSTWKDIETRFRLHINPEFGPKKAIQINTAMLKAYRLRRLEEHATDATINRELEAMRHAYKLGLACTPPKILHIPKFPIVKERNVRKGFFEKPAIDAICRHLPAHLIPVARFGYITGWRHGEVIALEWRHVHFEAGEIRLEAFETKSEEGRTFPMVRELRILLESVKPTAPFPAGNVFLNNGKPIRRFDGPWTQACRKAGLPIRYVPLRRAKRGLDGKPLRDEMKQLILEPVLYQRGKDAAGVSRKGKPILVPRSAVYFHDFRRTAYRNLVRLGVPESVAQKCVGWSDPDTARRYDITSKADLDVLKDKFDAFGASFGASRSDS